MMHSSKRLVVLKVLKENKVFHFSNRALRSGTAPNKWLSEGNNPISPKCSKHCFKKLIYSGMEVPEIYVSGNQLSAE